MTNSSPGIVEPFTFYTRLTLSELTGLRALNLKQLVDMIAEVPDSCIYYHTHRFLQQHQYISPEPPNDFAYWVSGPLSEKELGEQLASIDTVQFCSISELRDKFIYTISRYLDNRPDAALRFTNPEEAFYFIKSVSFVLPTQYVVYDTPGFIYALENVAIDSLYFHIFEARLRLGKETNDFSNWLRNSLKEVRAAEDIERLDPYTCTLEELRAKVIRIVSKKRPPL